MADRISVWVQARKDRKRLNLQWIDPVTGKRKSVSAKTDSPEIAEQRRADKEYELNHGVKSEPSRLSWEWLRKTYHDEKLMADSKANRKKADYIFDEFDRLMNPKTLGKIDEPTISKFTVKLRESGLAPSTVKGYLTYLRAILRWAAQQRYIPTAPTVRMPKIPKGTNKRKIKAVARLTTEEFERLLMKCPSDGWRLLLSFVWHCGMRRNEARSIRGEQIDLRGHTIHLPANKAGDEAQSAFVTPELDAMLRRIFPRGIPRGPLVSGIPVTQEDVSNEFRTIAIAAGVRGNGKKGQVTLHDLRRNYGSRWAGKVPAQVLKSMMRHSSLQTTLEFYADADDAAVAAIWSKSDDV